MSSYISFKYKINFTFQILDCVGPLNPEVVQSTPWASDSPASNVLNLGEDYFPNGTINYWVDGFETIGQGFTMRVDSCSIKDDNWVSDQKRRKRKASIFHQRIQGIRLKEREWAVATVSRE